MPAKTVISDPMEIGILFDIDDLGEGFFRKNAYRLLFELLDPKRLTKCKLLAGHTVQTRAGSALHYCIAIQALDPSQIRYVKDTLADCSVPGLVTPAQRFLESPVIEQHQLQLDAQVDLAGNLVVHDQSMPGREWTEGTPWSVAAPEEGPTTPVRVVAPSLRGPVRGLRPTPASPTAAEQFAVLLNAMDEKDAAKFAALLNVPSPSPRSEGLLTSIAIAVFLVGYLFFIYWLKPPSFILLIVIPMMLLGYLILSIWQIITGWDLTNLSSTRIADHQNQPRQDRSAGPPT